MAVIPSFSGDVMAIALHTSSNLPAGVIGYGEGPFYAAVNSMDIQVRGVGGHGSATSFCADCGGVAAIRAT